MSKLDSEWGRGPRYKQAELDALDFLKADPEWKGLTCIVGPNQSRTDGLWTRDNTLQFLTEVKSRDSFGTKSKLPFTWENLVAKYKGEYMISKSKIVDNVHASKVLGVPFFLIVNFMLQNKLLTIPISNREGEMIVNYKEEERITQNTSNGGIKKDWVYQLDVNNPPPHRWKDMSQIK